MTKKLISLLLVIVMISSVLPLNVAATVTGESTAKLSVEQPWGNPGNTIDVNLTIAENPGVLGATLVISWDESLILTADASGEAFSHMTYTSPSRYNPSGTNFVWFGNEVGEAINGTVLTLTFEIPENAENNDLLPICVTYIPGDVIDGDDNDVILNITDGYVRVITYKPGDVTGDGRVNSRDLVRLSQYISDGCTTDPEGYNAEVVADACDVTEDGRVNARDLIKLSQYVSDGSQTNPDGYNAVLKPAKLPDCSHSNMAEKEANDATCTDDGNIAYWYCSECGKYFSDANGTTEISLADTIVESKGHTEVIDEAVSPTYSNTGLTEGSHCSVCGTVIIKQEIVPALTKNEYSITYRIANSDLYLAGLDIDNQNPITYTSQDGVELQDLIVDGYNFKGWYTAQTGGTQVTEIPAGTTGNKVLYAQWEKVEYTITFDSPDVPVSSVTYTVDKGITLTNPTWFGYTFVGWSMDGKIVTIIKPGTTGNLTLHANWTSNRNKAKAVNKLSDPSIIEDMDNGRYLFVYEIGTIENVPLSEIEYIGNSQGITINKEYEYSTSVGEGFANTIANTVSNATTKTSSWTLSEEWNQTASATNEHEEEIGKTDERTDSEGNVIGSQYYISNSSGGSTASTSSAGGSNSVSAKVTEGSSVGFNDTYSSEASLGGTISASVEVGVTASAEVDTGVAKAGASSSVNAGISSSISAEEKQSVTNASSRETNVGTENSGTNSSHWDTSSSSSSNWNSTNGYESSTQTSTNKEISNTISEVIFDRYSYTSSDSRGETSSATQSTGESQELTDEYASTIEYSVEEQTSVRRSITYSSDATGYYRIVNAGTVHVFAVVGYDIATNSYFTYTYNVLDKERHTYLDYSKDNANFNDCENAILPFEVPYFVHEYISGVIARSSGLSINPDTGFIDEYSGNAENVIIPEYVSVNNGDGTYSAIRVRGITSDAFSGNTTIKAISLPKYVYAIPDNAFEGCSALETVIGYGISEIGNDAFKGCTMLGKFIVDKYIAELGDNAFVGVNEVYINAVNADVATAAINSGAAKITLNLSDMSADENFNNRKITISDSTEYFAFISNGASYSNLQIESDASETFISNVTFKNNTDTPLKLSSAKVTLNRVTVENSPGFAMILTADNTEINLFGNIILSSKGDNTLITKNVTMVKANPEVSSTLKVTGNYLICGQISNSKMITVSDGTVIAITDEQFNSYLTASIISFDANGGSVTETTKTVYYGQTYGTLPTPTRAHYTFAGWYTEKNGGTKITADTIVSALANQTLYAKWDIVPYKISWYGSDGVTIVVKRTASPNANASIGTLTSGETIYYGDVLAITYTKWDYYKILVHGSTSITVDRTVTSADIYATTKLNDVTGWVKASELPSGAQVVSRKYTYTEHKTSNLSTMSGWTLDKTTSVWSDYGAWSAWQDTPVTETDSRDVDTPRQVISHYQQKTQYRYSRYLNDAAVAGKKWNNTNSGGLCYPYYTANCDNGPYYTDWMDTPYKVKEADPKSKCGYKYGTATGNYDNLGLEWYNQETRQVDDTTKPVYKTQYRYRDRSLIYTYYFSKNTESTTKPSGSNISNVQEWVQYRAK